LNCPAQPRHGIAVAHVLDQALGDILQQLSPGVVAEAGR